MKDPEAKRWIVITITADGPPLIDAQGFDTWALYSILNAAMLAAWENLPDAAVVNVRES